MRMFVCNIIFINIVFTVTFDQYNVKYWSLTPIFVRSIIVLFLYYIPSINIIIN